ncbi:TIGR03757 family integrating conjugative element protein [Methylophaga sp.]|uniref:TIGR03757 family integrating conjugative element protein n=1 Tax=Methylophaga sp. TaxID=2024840 RepID=UPI00271F3212|nr:TIGR03757 family integrating conjugative element protein [Methylophaga sp.]MDO8828256.1 TIGR03757 family integrating conjugative element protein [Methylophaga sp.]
MNSLTLALLKPAQVFTVGFLLTALLPAIAQSAQPAQSAPLPQQPPVIEVIHSDAEVITGTESLLQQGYAVQQYNLDAPRHVLARLSQHLPAHQAAAQQQLEQQLQARGPQSLHQQLLTAYQGLSLATQYRLDRYPAVVFEQGRAVVYGVTDLHQALLRYRQWQKSLQPGGAR